MPDLFLYRRHVVTCKFAGKGTAHTKCACPIWSDGTQDGRRVRKSMGTKDWNRAERRLAERDPGGEVQHITIDEALSLYLDDCRARGLAESSIVSYENVLHAFKSHCATTFGISHAGRLSPEHVTSFRASRKAKNGTDPARPATHRKELEHIRALLSFCVAHGWTEKNPARAVKPPIEHDPPTLPFAAEEVTRILEACDLIGEGNHNHVSRDWARARARALVLVLLYSGLRISDAAVLERSRLDTNTGRLLLRIMKTRAPLFVTLPAVAVKALQALPEKSSWFLWSGRGKQSSHVGSCRRTIDKLTELAAVPNGHPHRFRDTFAVSLLENDVPIRTVQLLLGHSSVQTTERHYAPFVKSQQRMLDAAVAQLNF